MKVTTVNESIYLSLLSRNSDVSCPDASKGSISNIDAFWMMIPLIYSRQPVESVVCQLCSAASSSLTQYVL